MVSVDLYSRWPSIRRRTAPAAPVVDPARASTLDGLIGQQKAQRADPNRVADLLSQLVTAIEGRPLTDFVPMAQAVPLLIGLTPGNLAAFDEFLGSFIGTVVGDLGRVVTPGSVTSPADSVSANRRHLAAASLGVTRAAAVQPGRSASVRKFDDLMAFFSEGATLAVVLGEADDGLPPGTAEIVNSMLVAIRNNLKAGDVESAQQAGADAGVLIAAVHAAFFTEASEKAGKTMRKVGRNHWLTPGYETRKKGRAHVIGVDVDGETVATKDVKIADGKFVRRRKRKA